MNTSFTFAELLTSPIPHHHPHYHHHHEQEKLNYYYYYYNHRQPYQQHWQNMPTSIYTQPLAPPTPQPQPMQPAMVPLIPSPSPPLSLPLPQQQQTMTRTRGRRVSNIPNHGTRMFACKIEGCGKVFKRSEHLKRHVRSIHTMEKPFKCPYQSCNKRFSRSDNLNQHIRIHRHSKSPSCALASISNSPSTTTHDSSRYTNSLYFKT